MSLFLLKNCPTTTTLQNFFKILEEKSQLLAAKNQKIISLFEEET